MKVKDPNKQADQLRRVRRSKLKQRLEKHGSRGIVKVKSAEGSPVTKEAARNLIPAG